MTTRGDSTPEGIELLLAVIPRSPEKGLYLHCYGAVDGGDNGLQIRQILFVQVVLDSGANPNPKFFVKHRLDQLLATD